MMPYSNVRLFQPQRLTAPRHFKPIPALPICLEIGAGKGKHAIQFAQQYPEKMLIAIERTRLKFEFLQAQYQASPLANLQPIHADAIPWVVHALYPSQVEQLFILYPNPEPNNPAQRWLNMPFFEYLLSRIQSDGQITIASNVADYIQEACQQLEQIWHLPYIIQDIKPSMGRTHFEVKYLARGERCQQLIIIKPARYRTRFDLTQPRLGR